MIHEESFNNGVIQFLNDDPNSDYSKLLKNIQKIYPQKKSFYSLLDSLVYELGFDFLTIPIEVHKGADKYIPCFRYYKRNELGEQERIQKLIDDDSAMSIKEVYSFLGKETVYRLMRIPDLEVFIHKKLKTR